MNPKIPFIIYTLFANICISDICVFFKKIVFSLNNIIKKINIHRIKQKNRKVTKSIYECYI